MVGITSKYYDLGKTWGENYVRYLKGFWELPQDLANPNIGVLAKAAFVRWLTANISFDETTGFTRVSYKYEPELIYILEQRLPRFADDRGWTKTLI